MALASGCGSRLDGKLAEAVGNRSGDLAAYGRPLYLRYLGVCATHWSGD